MQKSRYAVFRSNMPQDSWWTIISSVAAAAAAAFAGAQIWYARRDANARAAFEHIRQVDDRVQAAWHSDPSEAQKNILAYYRGETTVLPPAATAYLGLLNCLDMLALAVKHHVVADNIIDEHIATLISPELIPLSFLKDMQKCCRNPRVYEHLYGYLSASLTKRRTLPRPDPSTED